MSYHIEITKEFRFEAAHCLPGMPEGHPYTRLHGHSFRAEITLAGPPDPQAGWIMDFAAIDAGLAGLRARLDHQTLNDITGLENPTLEVVGAWIFTEISTLLPGLVSVRLCRDSVGESCTIRRVA